MICKKCSKKMTKIDHMNDNGKLIDSYRCSCGTWCQGRNVNGVMKDIEWHENNEVSR